MTPTTVTATAASLPASPPTAAPEASPVSADFLALLLLTIGVGTGTSQSESDTSDHPADDRAPVTAAPDATTLGTTASVAIAATTPMITPALLPAPVVEPTAPRANEAAPTTAIDAAATEVVTAAMTDTSSTTSTPRAARPEPATTKDGSAAAPEARHALAELGADKIDGAAEEIAVESAPAPTPRATTDTTGRPATKANDAREADRAPEAAGTTTAPKPVTTTARPEAMTSAAAKPESSRKPETGERNAGPPAKPDATPHGADVVALHAHAEITPRAVTVDGAVNVSATHAPMVPAESHIIADQIVRAARLVVDDGLAQMRVDLQPPVLGAVRVEADIRGEVVMLTITAERPETQALLTQALPDIQQALVRRDVGPTSVAIIGSATPLSSDGRRAPERRPETPRERPTSNPGERRRTLRASRGVSAVDITV